ncbi:MAG: hypothetical protein WAN66_26455 [Limnoraphis robusta]|uniref:Uncharacterized protein n=2 Tax=Limnoraphis robusta TaxID=1118279 RepID=A0A0F5YCD7_9CYAN|nr:hypothetical protein [Limnoraphis robusta]KKD36551.1 hypothetical protein WN50_19150 [Limnoraphis robusta CS-951]MEA5501382.1 hypothetical protein [Limnoraphis robusta BA-68 BA1]MEA5519474.1 hypothetical protein [Limnoraphis robusta CCNP1315]MEA5541825.1 hypothetical protein [Limnoraphis robusta Tam1]MEA5548058.1 hypothetical protein [Limnoraphis robusta CCNP1324]
MKRTILLGWLILSTGFTATQMLGWTATLSRLSNNKVTIIADYTGNDEDGEREDVKTKPETES